MNDHSQHFPDSYLSLLNRRIYHVMGLYIFFSWKFTRNLYYFLIFVSSFILCVLRRTGCTFFGLGLRITSSTYCKLKGHGMGALQILMAIIVGTGPGHTARWMVSLYPPFPSFFRFLLQKRSR